MRRPSPPVCKACYRPHIRLVSEQRSERRRILTRAIQNQQPDLGAYALQLFDHLTLAPKALSSVEEQLHPAPSIPSDWSARGLFLVNSTVTGIAHGMWAPTDPA